MPSLGLQTQQLLARYHEAIRALAIELEWRHTVPDDRVRQIIAENPPTPRRKSPQALAVLKRRPPLPYWRWRKMFHEIAAPYTGSKDGGPRFVAVRIRP